MSDSLASLGESHLFPLFTICHILDADALNRHTILHAVASSLSASDFASSSNDIAADASAALRSSKALVPRALSRSHANLLEL